MCKMRTLSMSKLIMPSFSYFSSKRVEFAYFRVRWLGNSFVLINFKVTSHRRENDDYYTTYFSFFIVICPRDRIT